MHEPVSPPQAFWHGARPIERIGYAAGTLLLIGGLIHAAILTIDGGSWDGPLSMRKAASFGVSFGLTLLTIVWISTFLELRTRTRTRLLAAFTLACAVEVALVSLQVWRGVPSHFNISTGVDSVIARTLALGGAVLIIVIVALTMAAFRANRQTPPSLRLAIRAGFLTLCIALGTGAAMIARGMSLVFAGHPQEAYATGGSLKPVHGLFMHGILLLPALAWALRRTALSESHRVRIVWLGTIVYVALAGILSVLALGG